LLPSGRKNVGEACSKFRSGSKPLLKDKKGLGLLVETPSWLGRLVGR
jgi:hypothetical protein